MKMRTCCAETNEGESMIDISDGANKRRGIYRDRDTTGARKASEVMNQWMEQRTINAIECGKRD